MTINDLSYPVVSISGKTMAAFPSEQEFARGTRTAVASGYFNGIVVIDSNGNRRKLSTAKPLGSTNPLVLLAWFLGFPVALVFSTIEVLPPITLLEFKDVVRSQINRDRGFWNSVGVGVTGLGERVREASTFQEVISIFF